MDTKKSAAVTTCLCGCEGSPKAGRFLPGHDARLKSDLVKTALGGSKRAAKKLEELGWAKFLVEAKARLEAKKAREAAQTAAGEQ